MRRRDVANGMLFLMVTALVCTALSAASTVAIGQSISIAGHVVDNTSAGLPGVVAMAVTQTGGDAHRLMLGR